jgi:hypothetical protein
MLASDTKKGVSFYGAKREDFRFANGACFLVLLQRWEFMHKRDFESPYPSPAHWNARTACQALCLALILAAPGGAQIRGSSPSLPTLPSGAPVGSREDYDIPSRDRLEEARRLQALNIARQKGMVSDANKLLKLTTELNEEIARTNSGTLTPAQIRKLAQIEKLAHSVSQKMGATVLPSTWIQSPLDPRLR